MEFLRKKREEKKGLTQAKVAKRLGRYQSYVTDYERGQKNQSREKLEELVRVMGLPPAAIDVLYHRDASQQESVPIAA